MNGPEIILCIAVVLVAVGSFCCGQLYARRDIHKVFDRGYELGKKHAREFPHYDTKMVYPSHLEFHPRNKNDLH